MFGGSFSCTAELLLEKRARAFLRHGKMGDARAVPLEWPLGATSLLLLVTGPGAIRGWRFFSPKNSLNLLVCLNESNLPGKCPNFDSLISFWVDVWVNMENRGRLG